MDGRLASNMKKLVPIKPSARMTTQFRGAQPSLENAGRCTCRVSGVNITKACVVFRSRDDLREEPGTSRATQRFLNVSYLGQRLKMRIACDQFGTIG